jgi:hypothetical protein
MMGAYQEKIPYQTDVEEAQLARLKYAPLGWAYQAHMMEITTSKIGGIYSEDKDGNPIGFATMKFYNSAGIEITSGLQADLDASCVHTKVIWEPSHSIEIISGSVKILNSTSENIRLWATAAPHIPEASGGKKRFLNGGLNFKFMNAKEAIRTDGRSSKHIAHDPVNFSHRWDYDIKHPIGVKFELQLLVEFYKS